MAEALRLERIETLERLLAIAEDWRSLHRACRDRATVFQSHEWAVCAAEGPDREARLAVLAAWAGARLVAVAPLVAERQFGLVTLRWAGGRLAIYGDVLALPEVDVPGWLGMALEDIARERLAHNLRLDNVREDARIAPFLPLAARLAGAQKAPYLDLQSAGTFEAWRQGLSRSTRKSRGRRLRDLEARGRVTFEFGPGNAASGRRIADLFAMKRAWSDARSVLSLTIGDRDFEALVMQLATGAGRADARISSLLLDGRPIAVELGFVNGGRYLSYLGAYDPEFADFSPGALQLERTLEACFAEGLEIFDLLPPADDYKASWAVAETAVFSHGLAITRLGGLHQRMALVDPIGLAKAVVRRVPPRHRWLMQSMLLRARAKSGDTASAGAGQDLRSWGLRGLGLRVLQVLAVGAAVWAVAAE